MLVLQTRKYNLILVNQQIEKFDGDDVGGFLLTTSGSGDVSQVVNNGWVSEPNQNKFFFRVGGNNQFIKFQQSGSDETVF